LTSNKLYVLTILLLFFIPGYAVPEKLEIQVTSDKASVHLWPDAKSQIIGHIPPGTILYAKYKEGDWYKVHFRPSENAVMKSGFMHKRDVKTLEAEKKSQPQISISGISPIVIEDKGYKGEPVSLKFRDADIRDIIVTLCEVGGWSVVFDPGVMGEISCELNDVPWDQALDVILKTQHLAKKAEGKVFRIGRIKDLIDQH